MNKLRTQNPLGYSSEVGISRKELLRCSFAMLPVDGVFVGSR